MVDIDIVRNPKSNLRARVDEVANGPPASRTHWVDLVPTAQQLFQQLLADLTNPRIPAIKEPSKHAYSHFFCLDSLHLGDCATRPRRYNSLTHLEEDWPPGEYECSQPF